MGKLLAGAARRCITPSIEIFEKVKTEGKYTYQAITGDVYLRVAVLSDGTHRSAVIISDLSIFPLAQVLVDNLEEKYRIDPLGCVIGGTRGHNAISVNAESFDELGAGTAEYVRFVHQMAMDAVAEALDKLVPARIGAGYGESGINACREYVTPVGTIEACNRSTGTKATLLPVVKIEDMQGNPIAVIVTYSMHACALSWNQFVGTYNNLCGDFATLVTRFVEKTGKNAYPVMWAAGACSEQAPAAEGLVERCEVDDDGNFHFVRDVLPAEATLMLIKQNASEQGLEIIRTMNAITEFSDEYRFFGKETYRTVKGRLPFSKFMYKDINEGKHMVNHVRGRQPDFVPEYRPAADIRLRFRLLVLNGIAFASSNAELFSTIGEQIRRLIPCSHTSIFDVSFGNGGGSIPDAENEEQGIWGLTAWGSRVARARDAHNAYLDAFTELAEAYRQTVDVE